LKGTKKDIIWSWNILGSFGSECWFHPGSYPEYIVVVSPSVRLTWSQSVLSVFGREFYSISQTSCAFHRYSFLFAILFSSIFTRFTRLVRIMRQPHCLWSRLRPDARHCATQGSSCSRCASTVEATLMTVLILWESLCAFYMGIFRGLFLRYGSAVNLH